MNRAWGTMTQMIDRATREQLTLDKVYAKLMAPPIGLKEGPIPVLLTALLLNRRRRRRDLSGRHLPADPHRRAARAARKEPRTASR